LDYAFFSVTFALVKLITQKGKIMLKWITDHYPEITSVKVNEEEEIYRESEDVLVKIVDEYGNKAIASARRQCDFDSDDEIHYFWVCDIINDTLSDEEVIGWCKIEEE
jgi:hypothetical protein